MERNDTFEKEDRLAALKQLAGDSDLIDAGKHMIAGKLGAAEPLCRDVLKRDPLNVNAMCMLADIGVQVGAFADAKKLLKRCLELAPDFHRARAIYANALFKQQQYEDALQELDKLAKSEGNNTGHAILRGNIYAQVGRHEDALACFDKAVQKRPDNASIHMSLGHTLKTIGRQEDAVAAYKNAAKYEPTLGDAYWSLANLKTYKFDSEQLDEMRKAAASREIDRNDFFHLCFALGKALEDRGEYEEAFMHYRRGNAVKRRLIRYDADAKQAEMESQRALFTKAFVDSHEGSGSQKNGPIFIVGLPRAGSTLIEQILASHSMVEGTQELPDIISIARRISGKKKEGDEGRYPEALADLSNAELTALGEEYLERTQIHRTGKPYFIDKMPNNFAHVGLIQLILPNAIIIDARRNPMDCCFSGYKQLFARGQNFTYSLKEIGRYYQDYVHLMRHWDSVMPGRVLRVINEDLIAKPEEQIHRILEFCGLPFEEACLSFHETQRAVKTASSEQVRQPINAKGIGRWRHFESQLEPLRSFLGGLVDDYKN